MSRSEVEKEKIEGYISKALRQLEIRQLRKGCNFFPTEEQLLDYLIAQDYEGSKLGFVADSYRKEFTELGIVPIMLKQGLIEPRRTKKFSPPGYYLTEKGRSYIS